ncbi:FHA domain-containing protein [Kribbella sp. NPDC051586]|uniref:FHA domain-containing protein n=1 Tax=Kribbella sp. NPDC051586 TaxID=3364118 RepID=UPI0037A229B3
METEFVLSLGEQRWTLPAGSDTFTIGRASNADIRLQADDQISRIHARLARDGATWTLHDESRNGTGLNGRRITAPTALTTGDRIHIGRSVLTFHKSTLPDPVTPAAAPEPPAEPAPVQPPASSVAPAEYAPADPAPEAPPAAPTPPVDPAPTDPGYADPGYADSVPADSVPAEEPWSEEAGYGEPAYEADRGEYESAEHGPAGVVPGFDVERGGDGNAWAAYPSADNPEPVRSPWEISARIEQSEPNWNASDSWPISSRSTPDQPPPPSTDRRTSTDRRASADRRTGADRRAGAERLPTADPRTGDRRTADLEGNADDAVGTVRLPRVLIVAAGVIVLGLVANLIVTFLSEGPGGQLRWLVPPGIALVVAMVLALLDAAAPKDHRPGRFDVSILIAIAVVLGGVGVGGFVVSAGTKYVAGYLTGNESGEDRLVKPVAKPSAAVTVTVENVTYTSHFTRVEVMLANGAKEPVTIPIDGTTFTAADGTTLHVDTGRSSWPRRVAAGGTEHGAITFKGHLPDSTDAAVLTFKSGSTTFAIGVALSN